jgi:hypothetical protein
MYGDVHHVSLLFLEKQSCDYEMGRTCGTHWGIEMHSVVGGKTRWTESALKI